MTIAQVRSDTLAELLAECDVRLPDEELYSVSESFADHIKMELEQASYQFIGPTTCQECAAKKRIIDKLENDINALCNKVIKLAKMPSDSSVSIDRGYVEIQGTMR